MPVGTIVNVEDRYITLIGSDIYRSEKLQRLLEEFGGMQDGDDQLKGNFLPLYIHDPKPFARWKSSISVYASIKLRREEAN